MPRDNSPSASHPALDGARQAISARGSFRGGGFPEPVLPPAKQAERLLAFACQPDHPHVARSLENYAALLRKTGRGNEAAKLEARAKAIRAKHAEQNPAN